MEKEFKTIEEQIEILKTRKLIINDEELARTIFKENNYYYVKDLFVQKIEGQEVYKNNVTLEEIYSLYKFDIEIRTHFLKYILSLERRLNTYIAYEFSRNYAHILIGGQSNNPQKVNDMLISEIKKLKNEGLDESTFSRIKKKTYGEYVTEYNDVSSIARMFLSDTIKELKTFDYIDKYDEVTMEYVTEVLNDVFDESKMALSVIKGK